jgi:hypothetical protein
MRQTHDFQAPKNPWCVALLLGLAALTAACTRNDDQVRTDVGLLVSQEGESAQAAADRLAGHGRGVLVSLEGALHTANARGRKNVVMAMRRLGDAEAIPLLRHVAVFDAAPEVQREAEETLSAWAAGHDARGGAAQAALRAVGERRQREAAQQVKEPPR